MDRCFQRSVVLPVLGTVIESYDGMPVGDEKSIKEKKSKFYPDETKNSLKRDPNNVRVDFYTPNISLKNPTYVDHSVHHTSYRKVQYCFRLV